jgi:transmembrane sensor
MRIPVLVGRYKSAQEREALDAEAARRFLKARGSGRAEDWGDAMDWAGEDPAHGVAFAKAEASWEFSERLIDARPPISIDDSVDVMPQAPAGWMNSRVGRRAAMGLLAATIVGAGGTALQLHGAVTRYRTDLGEEKAVTLMDGSVIHLNTETSVEVALRDTVRELRLLKGEARFDVAHDPNRPFLVTAGSATLRAVGTAFNVRLRSDFTELTVIDGVVAVRDGQSTPRQVKAGGAAAIRSGTVAVTTLEPAYVKQRLAWQNGLIELDGETLAQAVEEFNRYRRTPLVIGDPQLASLRIGGTFRSGNSDDFVRALADGFGIRAIEGSDSAIILMPAIEAQ